MLHWDGVESQKELGSGWSEATFPNLLKNRFKSFGFVQIALHHLISCSSLANDGSHTIPHLSYVIVSYFVHTEIDLICYATKVHCALERTSRYFPSKQPCRLSIASCDQFHKFSWLMVAGRIVEGFKVNQVVIQSTWGAMELYASLTLKSTEIGNKALG